MNARASQCCGLASVSCRVFHQPGPEVQISSRSPALMGLIQSTASHGLTSIGFAGQERVARPNCLRTKDAREATERWWPADLRDTRGDGVVNNAE